MRAPVQVALTIAGFDPSSGAGVTADLQVFAAHGLFGTACITALTVQSTVGVHSVTPVADLIAPTLQELAVDLPPAGVKIGMLGSEQATFAVADFLTGERARRHLPVVLDPVLRSSSGASLSGAEGLTPLRQRLLPVVDWITPNRQELAALSGLPAETDAQTETALRGLLARYPHLHLVATGGETGTGEAVELLLTPEGELHAFRGPQIVTTSTHGTGCAFSSALLARLLLGYAPVDAVAAAKAYVTEAIRQAPGLGQGRGPLHLLWPLATGVEIQASQK